MISPAILAEGEKLIRALSPDRRFYLTEPPTGFAVPNCLNGFATSRDVVLREHLITEGRWQGPAPIICLTADNGRDKVLGTVVHELSHCFIYGPVAEDKATTPADLQEWRKQHSEWAADLNSELKFPRWYSDHGADFIRIALHAHQRAWAAGFEIGLPEVSFAGELYHLSRPWIYKRVLAPELTAMASASMADVVNTKIPRSFLKFFREDAIRCSPFKKENPRVCAA